MNQRQKAIHSLERKMNRYQQFQFYNAPIYFDYDFYKEVIIFELAPNLSRRKICKLLRERLKGLTSNQIKCGWLMPF